MSFDTLVQLSISLSQPPIPLASFGVPLMLSVLTAPQEALWTAEHGTNLYIEVTPATWQTALTTIGVTSSEDLYLAQQDLWGQSFQPERAYLGRRATAVAMVRRFTITGASDGTYTITINGTAHAHVAAAETATQIRDALLADINAGAQADNVTATASGADALDVTADLAGETFTDTVNSSGGASPITVATQTPSSGLTEDITAIRAQVDDWYWILETTRASGNHRMIAATTEPLRKYYLGQTSDADAQSAAVTDIGSELGALSYLRTGLVWDDDDNDFVDAAWVGLMAAMPPGSASWHAKTLAGVTGILPTGESFLDSKRYNWLERFPAGAFTMTRHGRSVNGQFIDVVVGMDFIHNLIQVRCIDAMRSVPKIPYDESGAATLRSVIRNALLEASGMGIIQRESVVVTVPAAASQPDADRAVRFFGGITFSAILTGAVHSIGITGALAP